jgi:hypothetical protein
MAASTVGGAKQYGGPKGSAVPAVFSLRSVVTAVIENTAFHAKLKHPSKPRDPSPVGIRGLQRAMDFVARDMIAELARRLDPDFRKASAK